MPSVRQQVYLAFPRLRNVGATIQGLVINRSRYGRYYRGAVAKVLDRQDWTRAQLAEYQSRRLSEIVDIAAHHVPYYRELFSRLAISPNEVKSPDDLWKVPILEKDEVRADPLRFVDERLNRKHLLEETTTGTTGTPIRVLVTRRVQQEHYAFFEARSRRVAGLHYGRDPFVTFGVRHVVRRERAEPPFWCYNHLGNQLYMSVYHLAPQYLRHYMEELKKRPYKALMGYPSAISALAQYQLEKGAKDVKIPVAITSGETLHPFQRKAIEDAFDCRVFDQFGCAEMAVFGAEGACGKMHVSPDYGITEITDDAGYPTQRGRTGQLLCTGLVNDAQILLRYRLGDVATWDESACPCGSTFPVLKSIDGRAANAVILADGRKLYRMGAIDAEIPCVKEYQIVQEEIGSFTIHVVVSEEFGDSHRQQLVENFAANVGPAKIAVAVVSSIRRSAGGKFASVVSRVSAPERALTPFV